MDTLSIQELENITAVSDALIPLIRKKASEPQTFKRLLAEIQKFMDKNREKLFTNIVGRQILINEKNESDILAILGLEKNEIKSIIKESEYFKKFGELKLIDQLVFALPLILLSQEYMRIKKEEESKIIYLFTFFKPYASRESQHFRYGVNEAQMLYTVENLQKKFDLKKIGTIYETLVKISGSSYDNYIKGHKNKYTDKELQVIYQSGVASRVNPFLAKIYNEYKKNAGKSMGFDDSGSKSYDKDDDSYDIEDSDIQSDAAQREAIVRKVSLRCMKDPIDESLIGIATKAYLGSDSRYYRDLLRTAIGEITDKMADRLPDFFRSLISSFLFNINLSTGKRYTMEDFRTPIFIRASMSIFKKPGTKDANMLKVKAYINEMLETYSDAYINFGNTKKGEFRYALFNYFVLLVKNNK